MPNVVVASDGDCLCGLAIRHGFLDCTPLRAEAANRGLLERALVAGDQVTIPDVRPGEHDRATAARHVFKRLRAPEPRLRFVHGSSDLAHASDASLTALKISKYQTDRAGPTGAAAFTSGFGFHQDAHDDPDTFKIEVLDPDGAGPIHVRLEALKPVYSADRKVEGHVPFTGAEATHRNVDIECHLVGDAAPRLYRSRYLRLVTDELDRAAAARQTLLVTDTANGNGGAADRLEILDQRVRGSYELPGCKAAAPHKCRVSAALPVGEHRKRIRMTVSIFRTAVGGPTIGGITRQNIRRRVYKWFRRAYAQIDLSPRLMGPIQIFDPPSADMITISDPVGTPASGRNAGGARSTLSFDIDAPPGPAPPAPAVRIVVNLTAGHTPTQVCAAIVAALPAGFSGEVHTNATPTDKATRSADVIIRRTGDGERVVIRNETTTDTALTVGVARVNIATVNATAAGFANLLIGTPEARRLLRFRGRDDRLDFFVVGNIIGARGVAFIPGTDLAAQYQPPAFCRWSVLMSAPVMNGADNDPFTFPHEAGHVLTDAFHADNSDANVDNQLMTGTGTSAANAVSGSKRISGAPIQVKYQKFDPAQATPGAWHAVDIDPATRFRTRGAPVFGRW